MQKFSRVQIATSIAVLFHAIGFFGMLFFKGEAFVRTTPFHLLLMVGLLVYTHGPKQKNLFLFIAACFVTGLVVEIIGVHTGLLFGQYAYGDALGFKVFDVPLIIGINWFILMYCSAAAIELFLKWLLERIPPDVAVSTAKVKKLSFITDAATVAVITDVLLEPAAIKLSYWQWLNNDGVPAYNYICWFVISALLLWVFRLLKLEAFNKFGLNLLLIQITFFILVYTFL